MAQNANNIAMIIINLLSDVLFTGSKNFNTKPNNPPIIKQIIFLIIGMPIDVNVSPCPLPSKESAKQIDIAMLYATKDTTSSRATTCNKPKKMVNQFSIQRSITQIRLLMQLMTQIK